MSELVYHMISWKNARTAILYIALLVFLLRVAWVSVWSFYHVLYDSIELLLNKLEEWAMGKSTRTGTGTENGTKGVASGSSLFWKTYHFIDCKFTYRRELRSPIQQQQPQQPSTTHLILLNLLQSLSALEYAGTRAAEGESSTSARLPAAEDRTSTPDGSVRPASEVGSSGTART